MLVAQSFLEFQMSKTRSAKASKHARSPKTAAKAQRANQAVVRSPKPSPPRSVAAGSTASPSEGLNVSNQEAPLAEKPTTAALPLGDEMATVLRDDSKQAMRNNDSKQVFEFSSAMVTAPAYSAKLVEIGQTNMQLAFEFAQRLVTIKSPFEIPGLLAELTTKQMVMFRSLVLSSRACRDNNHEKEEIAPA
jgi:hypothetical protein